MGDVSDIRDLEGQIEVLKHELAKHEAALEGRALVREFAAHMQALRDKIAELRGRMDQLKREA
jgi:primosomal protein N''